MSYHIVPRTQPGELLIEKIAVVNPVLRERAADADAANAICAENFALLQSTGIASAFVPEELGGLGLESMHDWILAIAALAHGDGSVAIAISMHLSATRGLAAVYRTSGAGSAAHIRAGEVLRRVASGEVLICSTTTERGNDNLHPMTEAVRVDEGWRISGQKFFVTMSPIATHVATNVRMRDDTGDHIANVLMTMDTEGVEPQGDWDALGMRASGSQSVKFDEAIAPADALRVIGPWGQWSTAVLVGRTLANVPLVGAFLGIAEAAHRYAIDALIDAPQTVRPGVHHALAEMEILLASSQSILARMGEQLDQFMIESDGGRHTTYERSHELMKNYQSAKWVVNRNAIEIVSRAMDLFGGGGFLARNPLARLYRDVRAGPFMQPFSPIDAREYVGRVLLDDLPGA